MGDLFTLSHIIQLRSIQCFKCGVTFGMDEYFYQERRKDSKGFFCPNGHEQFFCESEADRLKKQLAAEQAKNATLTKRNEWAVKDAELSRERAEKLARKLKRTTNRIAKGVCPCCNRSFENLQRHMHSKHPDYSEKT